MKRHFSAQRGFTLVEMLVVISMIGALVALLLPAVMAAKQNAHVVNTSHNCEQVTKGIVQYELAKTNYPPALYVEPLKKTDNWPWSVAILPYIDNEVVLKDLRGTPDLSGAKYLELYDAPLDLNNNRSGPAMSWGANIGILDGTIPANRNNGIFLDWTGGTRKVDNGDLKDGASLQILITENFNVNAWNDTSNIWSQGIAWTNLESARTPINQNIDAPMAAVHARPAGHVNAFFIAGMADGSSRKINSGIDHTVYCRLMAPNDAEAAKPLPAGPVKSSMGTPVTDGELGF